MSHYYIVTTSVTVLFPKYSVSPSVFWVAWGEGSCPSPFMPYSQVRAHSFFRCPCSALYPGQSLGERGTVGPWGAWGEWYWRVSCGRRYLLGWVVPAGWRAARAEGHRTLTWGLQGGLAGRKEQMPWGVGWGNGGLGRRKTEDFPGQWCPGGPGCEPQVLSKIASSSHWNKETSSFFVSSFSCI